MAVISVPRALRDRLGEDASDSLVELLHQFQTEQTDHLVELLEERFVRRVVESETRLRSEMHAGFIDLQKQIGDLRADFSGEITDVRKEITDVRKEIADVRKEIADVRKEITVQTRWILAVLVAAAVLIPVVQRVMEAILP